MVFIRQMIGHRLVGEYGAGIGAKCFQWYIETKALAIIIGQQRDEISLMSNKLKRTMILTSITND